MDSEITQRQYGLWESPITPESLTRGITFSDLFWGHDGSLVWLEGRADRGVLVVQPPDGQAPRDFNSEYSVRARVGYGGGDFTVGHGNVYFVEAESGRLFRQPLASGSARPITPAFGKSASPRLSPNGDWLLFVHTYEGCDSLGIVDASGNLWPQKLVSGDDFYMQPAWHPDGERVAWISWNHPNMPWDGTSLCIGELSLNQDAPPSLDGSTILVGGENISVLQPEFSPEGRFLAYICDESGWWQLYLFDLLEKKHIQLTAAQAEHGQPAWVQGLRTYAFSPDGDGVYFLRNQDGITTLWHVDLKKGEVNQVPLDETYTFLDQIHVSAHGVALIASGSRIPARIITIPLPKDGTRWKPAPRVWRRSTSEELPAELYSAPHVIQWEAEDRETVHGLFYSPSNPAFEGVGVPPLITYIHGGPTGQSRDSFNPRAQFFTSRGYAVLEVNFRGSSGYGRHYRDLLRDNWGVYDVEDAVGGARYLVAQEMADKARLVIMGGSAGGYTVLKALVDHPGFFRAGICLYGISNMFKLAAETHKFEAHYLDSMVGPLPQATNLYRQRSPIFFVDKIRDTLAFFQGEDDLVVPRSQTDELVEGLRQRGIPHIYHLYPGEGHGFRKSETIIHFYQAVDEFLNQNVVFA